MKNNKLLLNTILVFILSVFAVYYVVPWWEMSIKAPFAEKKYKLWLDLQWWIELDYKVDFSWVSGEELSVAWKKDSIIEWLKSIVDKRVEALNISDSVITTANYWNEEHIIVQIPLKWTNKTEDNANIARAKEAIWKVIKIEFKEKRTQITEENITERKNIAQALLDEANLWTYWFNVLQSKYKDAYENVDSWSYSLTSEELKKYVNIDLSNTQTWVINQILTWSWKEKFELVDWKISPTQDAWMYVTKFNWVTDTWSGKIFNLDYVFVSSSPSEWMSAVDSKGRVLNDKYFTSSSVNIDQSTLKPIIELTFNSEWADIFGELTSRLKGQQIAIYVWWQQLTAPTVNDAILNWKAIITGQYTIEEAKKLSNDINSWVVPAPIYLTSERSIDAKLWMNSLNELAYAWIIWFAIIFIFMVCVYRISWVTASVSLLIYFALVLMIAKMTWTVLTLASIAWLILTLWMAIDANILIFERFKDELRSWVNMENAIDKSFTKSWSAIWDSNLTWIIISVILFIFWVNMIKWFGLMMWIWLVVSLFTAMFVSKLFTVILAKTKLSPKAFIWFKK